MKGEVGKNIDMLIASLLSSTSVLGKTLSIWKWISLCFLCAYCLYSVSPGSSETPVWSSLASEPKGGMKTVLQSV